MRPGNTSGLNKIDNAHRLKCDKRTIAPLTYIIEISGFQTRKKNEGEKKRKRNIVTEAVVMARKKVLEDKVSAGERNGEKNHSWS